MRNLTNWREATVGATRDITPLVREIRLDGLPPQHCAPGAHVNLRVFIAGQPDHRSYSVVRQESDGSLCIAVRAQPQSRGGSRYLWSLAPGSRVHLTPPACDFELALGAPHYLLIAGGIGVTPLLRMAQLLARRGASLRMLHAASQRDGLAYAEELRAALGERVQFFDGQAGQHLDIAAEIAALPAQAELYMCGPLGLMDAIRAAWAASGRPAAQLHFETFGSSGRHAAQPFTVRVPRLGLEVDVAQNQSMLDALVAAGMEVLHDCRRGECGLCALPITDIDGTPDHRDVFFSAQQHADNARICACVSRLAGGVVTVDAAFRGDPVLR